MFALLKDALIVLALVAIIGREVLKWRDKRKLGVARSGDLTPAYWEQATARLLQDTLAAHDLRVHQPDRVEAANERRQLQVKLNQLATQFELSIQAKERQLAEAITEIKRQIKESEN